MMDNRGYMIDCAQRIEISAAQRTTGGANPQKANRIMLQAILGLQAEIIALYSVIGIGSQAIIIAPAIFVFCFGMLVRSASR